MTAYIYITASLILYPLVGRVAVRQTNKFPKMQMKVLWTLCIVSVFVLLGLLTHIITVSQNLNWFLLTSIYLTVSFLLWLTQSAENSIIKKVGRGFRFVIFGIG